MSLSTDRALSVFEHELTTHADVTFSILYKKIQIADYHVLLLSADDQISEGSLPGEYDLNDVAKVIEAWKYIQGERVTNLELQQKAWDVINDIGAALPDRNNASSAHLRRFKKDPDKKSFFILVTGEEKYGLPTFDLQYLANLWQLEHGRMPLHASGVIHKSGLYVFLGASGAGKSTVASLSRDIGDVVVDDDQLLLHPTVDHCYSADGWGYKLAAFNEPLRAVFQLMQDKQAYLVSLSPAKVARFIMERNIELMCDIYTDEQLTKAFAMACNVARRIPAYELHFRKSADFWDLIDKRFSE